MSEPTPAVCLVAREPRLLRSRGATVAAGIAGRLRARVYVAWPDLTAPSLITPPAATGPNRWLRERFQPESRLPPGVGAATWVALRAGGAIVGGRPGIAVELAERVLERPLDRPQVTVWSGSADTGAKSNAFVWEHGAAEPALVVRMLPDPRRAHRLRREVQSIASVRRLLDRAGAADVAAALPVPTLWSGDFGGLFLTAEALDPLGGSAASDPRERVAAWLAALQRATMQPATWTASDTAAQVEAVQRAWGELRPRAAGRVAARTTDLLRELEGEAVVRCVQHGDLWRGNVSIDGPRMRVYDWEWTREDDLPFLDLWTYDLAEHRHETLHGRGHPRSLAEALAAVGAALRALGIDERFALASLPGAAAELTFRSRWLDGVPSGSEQGSGPLLEIIEGLVL